MNTDFTDLKNPCSSADRSFVFRQIRRRRTVRKKSEFYTNAIDHRKFMNQLSIRAALAAAIFLSAASAACTGGSTSVAVNSEPAAAVNAEPANVNAETALGTPAAGSLDATAAPEAVVREVYKIHGEDFKRNANRILGGKTRTYLDKFFDKPLADLIWKDRTTNVGEIGALDFDPIYNAQDADIKNLVVSEATIEGERARVPVAFQNYDRREKLTYDLVRRGDAWKISDIRYPDGVTLTGIFKEAAQNDAPNGQTEENFFAGTYRVGNTTCTVKPVKMAFEVKWAKGSGTMMFFFDGDESAGSYRYSSEDSPRGRDAFVFDDDTFTTGTFIRADGTEMPVTKIK